MYIVYVAAICGILEAYVTVAVRVDSEQLVAATSGYCRGKMLA